MPDVAVAILYVAALIGGLAYLAASNSGVLVRQRVARRLTVAGAFPLAAVAVHQIARLIGLPMPEWGEGISAVALLFGLVLIVFGLREPTRSPASPERQRAEEGLREAERRFRTLAQIAPDAILAVDRDFRIVYWNRGAERLFGYTRNEIIGRLILDLAPERHRQSHRETLEQMMSPQGNPNLGTVVPIKGLTKDGRELPIEFGAVAVGSGADAQLAAIIRDVSDRHRTETLLRGIVETQSAAVGESFFPLMTAFLASALSAKLVTIGTLFGERRDRIRTIAVHRDGQTTANFDYSLANTPCAQVLDQHLCLFERNVVRQFPDDKLLVDLGAQSYAGVALLDAQGRPSGVLALARETPIDDPVETTLLLRIFAQRASAELDRLHTAAALRKSEQRFRDFAEAASDWLWETDAEHRFTYIGPRSFDRTSRHPEEILGKSRRDLVDPRAYAADPEKWERHYADLDAHRPFRDFNYPLPHPDGRMRHISISGKPIFDVEEKFAGYRGTGRDVTDRVAAREAQRLAATVFETATEAILVTDANNVIKVVNPAFTEITGYSAAEAVGLTPRLLASGRHDDAFYRDMWEKLNSQGRWSGEIWNRRKSGEIYPEWLSIVAIRDGLGDVQEYVAIFSDFTQRKHDEETIRRQANFDGLTGLPNRRLFRDRLERAIAGADRNQCKLAVMFVDLDHFKRINDTLGHFAGDMVMREAAVRIRDCLREVDTVGRFGGDEFTVLVDNLARSTDAEAVARKILDQLSQPFEAAGQEVFISGSIGLALYPDDAEDAEALLSHADAAMYQAKESGRNGMCFYIPALNRAAQEHMRLERDLRHAIEQGQLTLHYQPIVDFATRRPVGAEALLRWNHPTDGLLAPERFLSLAEESGLIVPIGRWVLETACREAAGWSAHGGRPLTLSVNLSGRQFRDPQCVTTVRHAIEQAGLKPAQLVIEVPELLLLENSDQVSRALDQLHAMGVRLAIDNFGTGFSSLGFLRRYPVQILKVDRSFVANLHTNHDDAVAAEAIIAIARSLGIQVMGEGVERDEHRNFLQARTCTQGQGFLFSAPLGPAEFAAYLRQHVVH